MAKDKPDPKPKPKGPDPTPTEREEALAEIFRGWKREGAIPPKNVWPELATKAMAEFDKENTGVMNPYLGFQSGKFVVYADDNNGVRLPFTLYETNSPMGLAKGMLRSDGIRGLKADQTVAADHRPKKAKK